MYAVERQAAIAQLVAERSNVSVNELSERFSVTTETIRRDLDSLRRQQLLRRVHGGAVRRQGTVTIGAGGGQVPYAFSNEDAQIAFAALSLLPTHGSVILGAGQRIERLAALMPRSMLAVTNSLPIANILAGAREGSLYLLPGAVCWQTRAVMGEQTVAALSDLQVDVAFVEAEGITVDRGLSTTAPGDGALRSAIVAAARMVVVLVASSAVGVDSNVRFASLTDADVIVTASAAPSDHLEAIRAAGVDVRACCTIR